MAYIRKIKGSLVRQDSSVYVGEDTYLFYDVETGCIRITDGTPGGRPACIEGAGSGGVIELPTFGDFPAPGEIDFIYIDDETNTIYRWDETQYKVLNSSSADQNVEEYPTFADFPPTGESDVIYIDASTDLLYRWDGGLYVLVGSSGGGGGGDNDYGSGVINPSNTGAVYSETPTANNTLKFIVSIRDNTTDRFASAEVLVSYKISNGSLTFTHYALIGDKILYKCDAVSASGLVSLVITNNDINPIAVNVTRISTISL